MFNPDIHINYIVIKLFQTLFCSWEALHNASFSSLRK